MFMIFFCCIPYTGDDAHPWDMLSSSFETYTFCFVIVLEIAGLCASSASISYLRAKESPARRARQFEFLRKSRRKIAEFQQIKFKFAKFWKSKESLWNIIKLSRCKSLKVLETFWRIFKFNDG